MRKSKITSVRLTTANMAMVLNLSPQRVKQLAVEMGIKPKGTGRRGDPFVYSGPQLRKMQGRETKPGPKGART